MTTRAALSTFVLRRRRLFILATHVVLIAAAYAAAFALRFAGTEPPAGQARIFLETVPVLVVIRVLLFSALGLDRGFWRHFGPRDLLKLTKAITFGSFIFLAVLAAVGGVGPVPRTVLIMEWMITLLLTGGVRFLVRCAREGRLSWRRDTGKRTLVVGAGAAADRLLRELDRDRDRALSVIALVDDDPALRHMTLHGVPVAGTVEDIESLVTQHQIELVIIAISTATPAELRRIVDRCLRAKVAFKRLTPLRDMLDGGAARRELSDVQIEQLLVRNPVSFDSERVAKDLAGRVVLITGGAGSVGSELARQIARVGPGKLILVDQAESPLYFVHLELQRAFPTVETIPVIADITDREAVARVFERYRPAHVYHAAAYKHVPMMEANAAEAVRNNVLGTLRVAECAVAVRAQRFVLISTDKAVRPSSIMGATKRVAERIVLGWPSLRGSATEFRAVRFGNVLGSEGSVVPLFRRQLAAGGPITVTHPDVRRYFMTLPEAAQLVLQAATLPEAAGRIAMLDMGEPIRILELAEHLIRLSGLEPYRDVQIVFTGLRPGEKLHEELMTAAERTVPSGIEKISIVQTDEVDGREVEQGVKLLLAAAACDERAAMLEVLRDLVPECVPPLRGGAPPLPRTAAPRRHASRAIAAAPSDR